MSSVYLGDVRREARPVLMIFLTLFLVGGLLLLSGAVDGETEDATGPGGEPSSGGGAGSFVPGAPVTASPGGSPVPDGGAPMTIIQDVRAMMNRLPLDRNDPTKYDPKPRRTPN